MTRKTRKKTTIITETDRLLILDKRSGAIEGWCDDLDRLFGTIQPEEAAAMTGFRMQTTRRPIRIGKLESRDGPGEVPSASLSSVLKPA